MSYYCERCGRNHKHESKIGSSHFAYRSLPEEESKVNPNEIRLDPQMAQLNSPRAEPPASDRTPVAASAADIQEAGGAEPNQLEDRGHPEGPPGVAPPKNPEAEAQEQLKLLAEALGIDKLVEAVKAQQAQIAQLTRHQGEILQGAAPTTGGLDLTKYGITPETIQKGVKMVMDALLGGGGGEDEELVRAIMAEEKARKAAIMKTKVKLIYDAINNDLPLYAGEAPPGPLTPKKDGDKK